MRSAMKKVKTTSKHKHKHKQEALRCSDKRRYLDMFEYLKKNYVNEKEKESWSSKPEEVIPWLDNGSTPDHISSILNPQSHLSYDHL